MNRPERPQRPARPVQGLGPEWPATVDERLRDAPPPGIAGLEVADSSFGAWLAAGGDRRQGSSGPREPWTPAQRAAQSQGERLPGRAPTWDALKPHHLKR